MVVVDISTLLYTLNREIKKTFFPLLKKCFLSPLFKVYKKVIQFSFTPTKDILVFSFWFQFIQWIEHLCMNQLQNRYYSCFDRSPDSLIIFLEEQLSCSRHRITNFPNSESPIFTMKFLFWFFHDSANTFWGIFEI